MKQNSLETKKSTPEKFATAESADVFYDHLLTSRDYYPEFWGNIKNYLSYILKNSPESIRFGPQYHILTSKDEQLVITTTFIESEEEYGDCRRDFCIIVHDADGKVCGEKYQNTKTSRDFDMVDSWGVISIDESARSRSLTMPIELVNRDLLQKEANRTNLPVIMRVPKGTVAKQVERLKKQYAKTQDPALIPKIEKMEGQLARWLAVYGYKGKLGLNTKRRIKLLPNGPAVDLESISDITLTKTEEQVPAKIVDELVIADTNKIKLRKQRLQELKTLLKQ